MGGRPVRDDELFVQRGTKRIRAVYRDCETCGARFVAIPSQMAIGRGRFCSRVCALTIPVSERFWAKVARGAPDQCWEWCGHRDVNGYGVLGQRRGQPLLRAHRVSWELAHGESVPGGLFVLHHCDNPPCVNPAHLYVGTQKDNVDDRVRRGRGRELRERGDASPVAVLTEAQVRAVVAEVEAGATQMSVAAKYGIKQPQVSRLVRRESWAHLWE